VDDDYEAGQRLDPNESSIVVPGASCLKLASSVGISGESSKRSNYKIIVIRPGIATEFLPEYFGIQRSRGHAGHHSMGTSLHRIRTS
jgi:hypothetical protein